LLDNLRFVDGEGAESVGTTVCPVARDVNVAIDGACVVRRRHAPWGWAAVDSVLLKGHSW
jgi:hypothetical protein